VWPLRQEQQLQQQCDASPNSLLEHRLF
jgi:hypothetical protein